MLLTWCDFSKNVGSTSPHIVLQQLKYVYLQSLPSSLVRSMRLAVLPVHHRPHELLVVHVALRVLVTGEQLRGRSPNVKL